MRELQAQIIAELGVAPRIDPETEAARRVDFLCDYLRATHTRGFVLGISGGVDSTLAGRLAQLAVEKLRERTEEIAAGDAFELQRELDVALGAAWDEELEPFRLAAEGAPVRWLHRVS